MVTLNKKESNKFVKAMLKKEKEPISEADKRLALEVKYNMSKLQVDDGLCQRCRKNKATINYTDSIMSYTHGFVEHICKSCYDKIKKSNTWYKAGRKEILDEVKKLINKEKKNWISATDWDTNLKQGLKKLQKAYEKSNNYR
jgi:superfamily II helicase